MGGSIGGSIGGSMGFTGSPPPPPSLVNACAGSSTMVTTGVVQLSKVLRLIYNSPLITGDIMFYWFFIPWLILFAIAYELGVHSEKHYKETSILTGREKLNIIGLSIVPFIMLTLVAVYWIAINNIKGR